MVRRWWHPMSCLENRWKLANASDASISTSKGGSILDPTEILWPPQAVDRREGHGYRTWKLAPFPFYIRMRWARPRPREAVNSGSCFVVAVELGTHYLVLPRKRFQSLLESQGSQGRLSLLAPLLGELNLFGCRGSRCSLLNRADKNMVLRPVETERAERRPQMSRAYQLLGNSTGHKDHVPATERLPQTYLSFGGWYPIVPVYEWNGVGIPSTLPAVEHLFVLAARERTKELGIVNSRHYHYHCGVLGACKSRVVFSSRKASAIRFAEDFTRVLTENLV